LLFFRRRSPWQLLACLALGFGLAGCGGGGSSSSGPPPVPATPTPPGATPIPTATPLPGSSSATVAVSPTIPSSGSFGPVAGGYSGTLTLPAANAAAMLTATFLTSQPAGTPTIQNLKRRPLNIGAGPIQAIAFVTVSVSQTVTFPKTPDFTFTAPFSVAQLGAFAYVAEYDPTNAAAGWTTIEGPGAPSGNTLTFVGAPPPITLAAGGTYGFLLFSVPQAIPSPTATPVATATPVVTATPVATATPVVTATPVATSSPRPGLVSIASPVPVSPGGGHGGLTCPPAQRTGCMSTYAITSYPTGNAWKRVSADSTAIVIASGVAPATDTPPTAAHQWQYQFTPQNQLGAAFAINVDQVRDGAHQIYYNAAGDSRGSVDVSQLQSVRRGVRSAAPGVSVASNVVRRRFARFTGANVDQTHVYVRYRADVLRGAGRNAADVERAEGVSGRALPTLSHDPLHVVSVPKGTTATTFAQRLRGHREVADVSAVHIRHTLTRPAFSMTSPDRHFTLPDQWYLFADGFPNAWSYNTGGGATIAMIDTGIDLNNTDLAAASKLTFKEKVVNGQVTQSPQDTNGHGTNTAGIAAATANNGVGFAGGGFNVKLMAFDIFNDGTAPDYGISAFTSDEAIAIGDAVANGADVISMSIGSSQDDRLTGDGYDQGEYDAIQAALAAGVTVVAAAGNDADGGESGTPHTTLDFPAAYPGVIAVGATGLSNTTAGDYSTATEHVTSYSQYGPTLAVVAPGGDPSSGSDRDALHWIWNYSTTTSADPRFACSTPVPATSCTALFAGTSQATPQVSAAAALLIAAAGGKGVLSPGQIAQIIQNTADNINDPRQGHGRLNVYRAIASLVGDTAAYSGPQPIVHGTAQLIAFAYNNHGANRPAILDYDYPAGVPVATDGTFRIADVPDATGSYRVGVWYDGNGDGVIDAGDWAGVSPAACSSTALCAIGSISLTPVSGAYALP
jgi:hypothetical protein